MADDTVRVAIRIRPLVKTELDKGCQMCLHVVPGEPQIQIRNTDKAFTFNYVFPPNVDQENFYNTAIKGLLSNIFRGYNVTILAYGQTGSGKTHSMGTNYTGDGDMGVIPRSLHDIFEIIYSKTDWNFKVTISFIELYQEQLYDLLTDKARSQSIVDIREDGKGIKIAGITEKEVHNADEALQCLAQGSSGRITGATAMNAQSSRSHAIFTICVHQNAKDNPNSATVAKFHLVDLAGSERSKKTQATGERFKEGVNINKGLLALGNVISQLGEGGPVSYIGYRDSKLTRLLQDSLGGNSVTLMIACVSPADYNLDETMSTLRYADRARKIKNKPIVNQDPKSAEINRLNSLVQELRVALADRGALSGVNCPPEHQELQAKNWSLQKKLRDVTEKFSANLLEIVSMHEKAELAEKTRETMKEEIAALLENLSELLENFQKYCNDTTSLLPRLQNIYEKIIDMQNNITKGSQELFHHDLVVRQECAEPNTEDTSNPNINNESNDESFEALHYLDEKNEEHTLRQTERFHEVQTINRELAIKEELVSRLLRDSAQSLSYSKEVQDMEQEIKSLQLEKEELLRALQNIQASNASSKLAESRRKKVQELERKIVELSKKCLEQNKIIKMKESSDQQIKNLANEIQSLKQARVKLIRQMRSDADKFTRWKQSREKELNKLRDQDRKRVNEFARLQSQHLKQQNVLKRKMEEYAIVKKRLKEALETQKKVAQMREKTKSGKAEIRTWVTHEMEVLISTIDAECSLEKLMQDRETLVKQLDELKKNDSKDTRITELAESLDLRNAQIATLQQQILESDQENRSNTRWQTIQTMTDAKAALRILFDMTAENRRKEYGKLLEYQELMDKYEALSEKLQASRKQEIEERLTTRRLTYNVQDDGSEVRTEMQIERDHYKQLCEKLQQQLLNSQSQQMFKKPKVKAKRNTNEDVQVIEECDFMSDESLGEDDIDKDPDWTKTPLYNRIQKLWNTTKNTSDDRGTTKRSSDGEIKCACKTKCSTRLCTCRKNNVTCTNCNCSSAICQNKDKENLARTLFLEEENEEIPKKPRYDE